MPVTRRARRAELETPGSTQVTAAASSNSNTQRPPWRKILYERQPYPDNHTDETFLACLVTNKTLPLRQRPLHVLIFRALPLSARLASIALWLSAFFSLLAPASPLVAEPPSLPPPFSCPHTSTTLPLISRLIGDLPASPLGHFLCSSTAAVRAADPRAVVAVSLASIVAGTLLLAWGWRALVPARAALSELRAAVKRQSRRLALCAFALLLLAPAVGDLAADLSDRFVLVGTVVCAFLHTATYEYPAPASLPPRTGAVDTADAAANSIPAAAAAAAADGVIGGGGPVTAAPGARAPPGAGAGRFGLEAALARGTFSLNFIIMATVALCSRLPRGGDHAYALLFFACVLFAGLPPVLAVLQRARPRAWAALSGTLGACGWLALTAHSPVIGHVYAAAQAVVVVIAPAVFARHQGSRLKREYEGPWDYDDEGEAGRENI